MKTIRLLLITACCVSAAVAILAASGETIARGNEAESKLKSLQKEKVDMLKQIYELANHANMAGQGTNARVSETKRLWQAAQLDVCETKAERIQVLKEMVQTTEEWVISLNAMVQSGTTPESTVLNAQVEVINAKIALQKELQSERK